MELEEKGRNPDEDEFNESDLEDDELELEWFWDIQS